MSWKFELGDYVEGVIIARIEYLNGCKQYQVQPKGMKEDGGTKDTSWIDEVRLTTKERDKAPSMPPLKTTDIKLEEKRGGIREHPE